MSFEVPPPEGILPTDGWKGSAERRTLGESVTTTYTYTISHADGSITHRTVVDKDGERTTTDKEEAAPDGGPPKPTLTVPRPEGLAESDSWEGTVEQWSSGGDVTLTYNYTIHHGDGRTTHRTIEDHNGVKKTLKETTDEAPEGFQAEQITVPPPDDLGPTDSWSGKVRQSTLGGQVTRVYTYEIEHSDGSKTHRIVTEKDGDRTTEERKEAPPPGWKPKEQEQVGPPHNLPETATGWSASRSIKTDGAGVTTRVTTYTINPGTDQEYVQVETQVDDGEVLVERDAPPLPPP